MSDRVLSYFPGHKEGGVSPLALAGLLVVTAVYFIFGQMVVPAPMLLLPVAAIAFFAYSYNRESLLISILVLTITLVQLKEEKGEFTIYDAIAGAIIFGGMLIVFFRTTIDPEKYRLENNQFKLVLVYFFWVTLVGISNFLFGNERIESWFRDTLLLSPLLTIPPLMLTMNKPRDKKIFFTLMLVVWVICFIISVINVRQSFLEANFLFEVAYRMVNGLNGPLMLLVFFNLYMFIKRKHLRLLFFAGMVISVMAIILTHNRTFWVLTPLGILLSVLIAPRVERKAGFTLLFKLLAIFVVIFTIGYFTIPLFGIVLKLFLSYFLSSSNLKTDASLVGRYVEWRYIWDAILDSPIVGYGAGSTFHRYDWFKGIFFDAGYTHNGYLGVLHKGGLVGFIVLFGAYFGFLKRGWTLVRNNVLDPVTQALLRAGIVLLVLLLIATTTVNIFAHRDVMMYIALIWGYMLLTERTKLKRSPDNA